MVLKGIDLDQIETAVRWAVDKQLTSERTRRAAHKQRRLLRSSSHLSKYCGA